VVAQYIFTMRDLRRFYPPDREVLRGINLSFYPGAKIGVIGANGSGKSSCCASWRDSTTASPARRG
jgi:sulfate-transporting ATPase